MEVKTITYKRINNLGNYNSEHLEMTAELDENDSVIDCGKRLKNKVETVLGLNKLPVEESKINDDIAF